MYTLKTLAVVVLALILGAIGLSFLISDLGPYESLPLRFLIAGAFYLLSGMAFGYLLPGRWAISAVTAWGGIFMGGFLTLAAVRRHGMDAFTAAEPPYVTAGLIMLLAPLVVSLAGGYIGKWLKSRRAKNHGDSDRESLAPERSN